MIRRATLRLVPAPASARRFLVAYPDLAAMLRDQRLLLRDGRFEAALRASGQCGIPRSWLTTSVGDSVVESVVSGELAGLDPPADLGPLGQVALNPIRREASGRRSSGRRPTRSSTRSI